MLKYVLKRILSALVTIFFIITITFFLMKAIPGNPFAAEKMPNPEIEAAMMAKYGLDQPLWKQYIIYLGNFLRGDFGVSYTKAGLTVNKVIADGFPFSLTIGIYASLVVAPPYPALCWPRVSCFFSAKPWVLCPPSVWTRWRAISARCWSLGHSHCPSSPA